MGEPGRPAYLDDPQMVAKFLATIRIGAGRKWACARIGASVGWLRSIIGLAKRGEHQAAVAFYAQLREAEAEAIELHCRKLAESESASASTFMLTAMDRQRFGRVSQDVHIQTANRFGSYTPEQEAQMFELAAQGARARGNLPPKGGTGQ